MCDSPAGLCVCVCVCDPGASLVCHVRGAFPCVFAELSTMLKRAGRALSGATMRDEGRLGGMIGRRFTRPAR